VLALKWADEVIWSPDALQDLRYEYPLPMAAVGIALAVGLIRGWISGSGDDSRSARSIPSRLLRRRPDSAAGP